MQIPDKALIVYMHVDKLTNNSFSMPRKKVKRLKLWTITTKKLDSWIPYVYL